MGTRTLAFLVLLTSVASAQQLTPVQPGRERMTSRVVFVVDTSGSMKTDFGRALSAFNMISQQPVDQLEIAVIAFDDGVYRWPGLDGSGWAKLPDLKAVTAANAWLQQLPKLNGTKIVPALEKAFKVKKRGVTVVVISDGQFIQENKDDMEKIEKKRKGPVMCLGVGDVWEGCLKVLSKSGGMWTWKN